VEYRQKQLSDAIYLVSLIYIYNGENDRWDMRSIAFAAKYIPPVPLTLPTLNGPDKVPARKQLCSIVIINSAIIRKVVAAEPIITHPCTRVAIRGHSNEGLLINLNMSGIAGYRFRIQ
jgi:hypothetical protein